MQFNIQEETAFARSLIEYACEKCGVPTLSNRIDLVWKNRMTRAHGRAGRRLNGRYQISLSLAQWPYTPVYERKNTIVHETCHCIHLFFKKSFEGQPHGEYWQKLMRQCGVEPERTLSGDALSPEYQKKMMAKMMANRFAVKCQCATPVMVSQTIKNRILAGARHYRCARCKTPLVI